MGVGSGVLLGVWSIVIIGILICCPAIIKLGCLRWRNAPGAFHLYYLILNAQLFQMRVARVCRLALRRLNLAAKLLMLDVKFGFLIFLVRCEIFAHKIKVRAKTPNVES